MEMTFILLAVIVILAYGVGTATGFGSSLIALTLGANLFSLDFLVPVIIPVNLAATTYIAVRHFSGIDWRIFLKRIVPLAMIGQPIGMLVFHVADMEGLKWAYGLFVLCLSIFEMRNTLRVSDGQLPKVSPWSGAWLIAGGFVQGLWVSGGPLVAYWAARNIRDKGIFRSTLSALWFLLNSILLVTYIISGSINAHTARVSAWLFIPLVASFFLGERLHNKLPEKSFRILVYAVLIFAGASIIVRSL